MKFRMLSFAVVLLAGVGAASAQYRAPKGPTSVVLQQFQPYRSPRAMASEHVVAHQEAEAVPAPTESAPYVEGDPLGDAEGDVMPCESPCGGTLDWCGTSQGSGRIFRSRPS